MRWASYRHQGTEHVGLVDGDHYVNADLVASREVVIPGWGPRADGEKAS